MKDFLSCVHVVVKTLNLEIHVLVWQTTSKKSSKVGQNQHSKVASSRWMCSVKNAMKEKICGMLTTRLRINSTTIEIFSKGFKNLK